MSVVAFTSKHIFENESINFNPLLMITGTFIHCRAKH